MSKRFFVFLVLLLLCTMFICGADGCDVDDNGGYDNSSGNSVQDFVQDPPEEPATLCYKLEDGSTWCPDGP